MAKSKSKGESKGSRAEYAQNSASQDGKKKGSETPGKAC